MAIKLKKSYRFALRSSLIISILLTLALGLLLDAVNSLVWGVLAVYLLLSFFICFVVIQLRVEQFIYRRIKKIYDEVSLLESKSLANIPVTTDMRTLTEEIERFAQNKKVEISPVQLSA